MAVDYDLVVIGGGAAGLVAASAGAQLRAKVALVDKSPRLGGDCLHHGCVPSKALLGGAALAQAVRQAAAYGLGVTPGPTALTPVLDQVHRAIATIQVHDSIERFESLGVEVIIGAGQFCDRRTFQVGNRLLRSRAFLLATGSRPHIPVIAGLEAAGYQTNITLFDPAFNQRPTPDSWVVIGAGPIGCELGQGLARLGAQVTILAGGDRILPREDPDLAQIIQQALVAEGVRIIPQARPTAVTVLANGHKRLEIPQGVVEGAEILVAAGRVANGAGLNLAAAGVRWTEQGLLVNDKLQTDNPRIYGAGDVIGGYRFTHVASYEAAIVLQNALFFPTKRAEYRVIPWATFTAPELARVGLSETEARRRYGEAVVVLRQGFEGVDRAIATGETVGCAKLVVRSNGEILGAAIAGAHAGELIHEVVQAMTHRLKVTALHQYIHIYPTLSEVLSKAALQFTKQRYQRNQRLQGLLAGFFQWRRSLG